MKRIRFGRTNIEVPTISLGTWGQGGARIAGGKSVGWTGNDDAQALAALRDAWAAGITHWDTADVYGDGHAEKLIGRAFTEVPRREIFVASKFGYDTGPSGRPYESQFMRERCERSLRNLRTDVIDLYYFHHCDFGERDRYLDEALQTMQALRREGKIRFIGLSDWSCARIEAVIHRIDPDAVQPYRNIVDDEYASSGLAASVAARDLGVAFFSPLKHGLLLGKTTEPREFAEGDFRRNVAEFGDAAALARIARAANAVRHRFVAQPEPVLSAVTGALLAVNPTATVLLGQRTPQQVAAASKIGEALSPDDAEWVVRTYREA